jgi:hypothetical protein
MTSEVANRLDCIYLDYDGVLHGGGATRHRRPPNIRHELPGHELFEHLPVFEALIAPYPAVRIVLSTSWVRALDFERAKGYLTPTLQQRVIGATYHRRLMLRQSWTHSLRQRDKWQLRSLQARISLERKESHDEEIPPQSFCGI